jgi:diaminopimelate epimerase
VQFEKWQALGNDYLIIEADGLKFSPTPGRIKLLCDPHFGPGADGVLLLSRPTDPQFVAELRIFNPDGSEAELSGNGAREAIMYLRRSGWTEEDEFAISTLAGPIRPTITGPTTCRVHMGRALLSSRDFPTGPPDGRDRLTVDDRTFSFQFVSIGNPQCSIALENADDLEALDLAAYGRLIEHNLLFPNRTNVSWFVVEDDHTIRARIFERGVGETLSSGTGASGAAVAHVQRGGSSPVTVRLDGGELEVEIDADRNVTLTGWAVPVYRATLSPDLLQELHATE